MDLVEFTSEEETCSPMFAGVTRALALGARTLHWKGDNVKSVDAKI